MSVLKFILVGLGAVTGGAVNALAGGVVGGRLARWIKPLILRWVIVVIGFMVALAYFIY